MNPKVYQEELLNISEMPLKRHSSQNLTKKHFDFLAESLNSTLEALDRLNNAKELSPSRLREIHKMCVLDIAKVLEKTNPFFKRNYFIAKSTITKKDEV